MKTSVLLATGVNAEGYRELLGMQVASSESVASWTGFFRDLKARGLDQVYLVTSDAHLGIQHEIGDVLPNSSWQRCRTHFSKNLLRAGTEEAIEYFDEIQNRLDDASSMAEARSITTQQLKGREYGPCTLFPSVVHERSAKSGKVLSVGFKPYTRCSVPVDSI